MWENHHYMTLKETHGWRKKDLLDVAMGAYEGAKLSKLGFFIRKKWWNL